MDRRDACDGLCALHQGGCSLRLSVLKHPLVQVFYYLQDVLLVQGRPT